jgi:hydroxymethylpyrimidine pyrophosphatase-like HAD family hydrolase
MGNAGDKVKEAARYVTKSVEDDGIIHGLKMVGLL